MNIRFPHPRENSSRCPNCLLLLLISLFLSACGTFEIGLEPTLTIASTTVPDASSQLTLSGPSAAAGRSARVVFIKNGNVWLWQPIDGATPLTHDSRGGVTDVKLSDDGKMVAFIRSDALWLVSAEGGATRSLFSLEDLAELSGGGPALRLNRFQWLPGSRTIGLNTRLQDGVTRTDNLILINTITGEQPLHLPPGHGGEFYFSPDGRQIALVTPRDISLLNVDGSGRRTLFNYTPIQIGPYMHKLTSSAIDVETSSDYPPGSAFEQLRYYISPVWDAGGSALLVTLPPADPMAQPAQQTTIWRVPTDGTNPQLLVNLPSQPLSPCSFSPDRRYLLYTPTSRAAGGQASPSLEMLDLQDGDIISRHPGNYAVYGWSPDGAAVALAAESPDNPIGIISRLGHGADKQVGPPAVEIKWLADAQFLYLIPGDRGWDLIWRDIDGSAELLASQLDFPIYDISPSASAQTSAAALIN